MTESNSQKDAFSEFERLVQASAAAVRGALDAVFHEAGWGGIEGVQNRIKDFEVEESLDALRGMLDAFLYETDLDRFIEEAKEISWRLLARTRSGELEEEVRAELLAALKIINAEIDSILENLSPPEENQPL
jgi:hypothetical protein